MEPWFTLFLLEEAEKANKELSKTICSMSYIPSRFTDWLDKHKIIDTIFLWSVIISIGVSPFAIVALLMKFCVH